MCLDGLIRSAYTGQKLLVGELSIFDIENMARKGEKSVCCGADTNKRNLIYFMLYRHYNSGSLPKFVNNCGDFLLNNFELSNVFSEKHHIPLQQLLTTGILHD